VRELDVAGRAGAAAGLDLGLDLHGISPEVNDESDVDRTAAAAGLDLGLDLHGISP
jgi:hypothetical protein